MPTDIIPSSPMTSRGSSGFPHSSTADPPLPPHEVSTNHAIIIGVCRLFRGVGRNVNFLVSPKDASSSEIPKSRNVFHVGFVAKGKRQFIRGLSREKDRFIDL